MVFWKYLFTFRFSRQKCYFWKIHFFIWIFAPKSCHFLQRLKNKVLNFEFSRQKMYMQQRKIRHWRQIDLIFWQIVQQHWISKSMQFELLFDSSVSIIERANFMTDDYCISCQNDFVENIIKINHLEQHKVFL